MVLFSTDCTYTIVSFPSLCSYFVALFLRGVHVVRKLQIVAKQEKDLASCREARVHRCTRDAHVNHAYLSSARRIAYPPTLNVI